MTAATYRGAARAYRDALDMIGEYRGPCGLCGHPDRRHRAAEAMAGMLSAGEPPEAVLREHSSPLTVDQLTALASAVAAADPKAHNVSRARGRGYDWGIWFDCTRHPQHRGEDA